MSKYLRLTAGIHAYAKSLFVAQICLKFIQSQKAEEEGFHTLASQQGCVGVLGNAPWSEAHDQKSTMSKQSKINLKTFMQSF